MTITAINPTPILTLDGSNSTEDVSKSTSQGIHNGLNVTETTPRIMLNSSQEKNIAVSDLQRTVLSSNPKQNKYCLFRERSFTSLNVLKGLDFTKKALIVSLIILAGLFMFNAVSLLVTLLTVATVLTLGMMINSLAFCQQVTLHKNRENSELEYKINNCFAKHPQSLVKEESNKLNDDLFYKNLCRKNLHNYGNNSERYNREAFNILENKSVSEQNDKNIKELANSPFILDTLDILSAMLINSEEQYKMNLTDRLTALKPNILEFFNNKGNKEFIDNMITACSQKIEVLGDNNFIKQAMIYNLENYVAD